MDCFTAKQAAEKWGISANRITILCKNGRIPGATQIGGQWMIPNGTEKPLDGRTGTAKSDAAHPPFRFPLFVNSSEDRFFPPLSEEELLLKSAQHDYYACRFDEARDVFERISKNSKNKYARIISLFFLCSLSAEAFGGENFFSCFGKLQTELSADFPHKKDMETVIPWLYTITVQFHAVSDSLKVDPLYGYAPSVQPLISYLSVYHTSKINTSGNQKVKFDVYEILCNNLLQSGYYYEACELHFALFLGYYASEQKEAMLFHLQKGLSLVKEHDFYIIAASYEPYYQNAFSAVYEEFPEDFVKTLKRDSEIIAKSIAAFAQKVNHNEIFKVLSKNDYRYLTFASQGYTNKKVAKAMGVSERTVAKHYSEIYNKLGIDRKPELKNLLTESFSAK